MGRGIDRLTIRGFKSIRALDDFELRPLNVLIGANGAGKSNFVAFFRLLREMVEGRLQFAVRQHGGADAHLFLGPKVTTQIEGSFYFGQCHYEFVLDRTVRDQFVFGRETVLASSGGESLGQGHEESKLPQAAKSSDLARHVCAGVTSWAVYHYHDTSDTAGVRRACSVRDDERLRADAGNLAPFLLRHRDSDWYARLRDTVRLVAPFFDDFRLRPRPNGADEVVLLEWRQRNSDYPFHPSHLSDGTLRFICLATALLQPDPPATIVIDEPELGLHPQALDVLGGMVREAATRTQVILSTQCAPLLNQFKPEDIVVVDRKDGASVFRRLDRPSLEQWLKDYTLGELWQKNVLDGGPVHE